ncbi:hypothetical protein [Deinococcus misasensis]|uniref:hypothetical protein n=1 Tax=Deinococcus misasensis TaxID=392413 RepID=UPI000555EB97|nr:hypothetical protein [Deinococcus misasensis]
MNAALAAALASLPFQILGQERSLTLTVSDFVGTGAQIQNRMSPIAYYDVPIGHLVALKGGTPFRSYIKGEYVATIAPAVGVTHTVDLDAAGYRFARSARPAPTLPANNHPDILAYISDDAGATWTLTNVTAINVDTQEITVTKTASTNRVKIYYLLSDGEIEIRAARPVGSNGVSALLYNNSFRGLHEVNQTNIRSAPKFGTADRYSLSENFRLTIEANTNAVIPWVPEARHEIVIGAFDLPVKVTDPQRLAVQVEAMLRQSF